MPKTTTVSHGEKDIALQNKSGLVSLAGAMQLMQSKCIKPACTLHASSRLLIFENKLKMTEFQAEYKTAGSWLQIN